MLKLKISGSKNDLKGFRKWIGRALVILPKYKIGRDTEFMPNSKDKKYYRWEADLLRPLDEEGGKGYVQSNRNSESKGWGWKNHYNG